MAGVCQVIPAAGAPLGFAVIHGLDGARARAKRAAGGASGGGGNPPSASGDKVNVSHQQMPRHTANTKTGIHDHHMPQMQPHAPAD